MSIILLGTLIILKHSDKTIALPICVNIIAQIQYCREADGGRARLVYTSRTRSNDKTQLYYHYHWILWR